MLASDDAVGASWCTQLREKYDEVPALDGGGKLLRTKSLNYV